MSRAPGLTRHELLVRGAFAAAAASGFSAVGPLVRGAFAQSIRPDVEVAQFALLLERLERAYYERALREVPDFSPDVRDLARTLREDEAEHTDALTRLLRQMGGDTGREPRFDFGDAFRSQRQFLLVSRTLEETGVSAYNGAAPTLEQDEVLAVAGQIVQVEARHTALVRWELGEDITAGAFDRPLDKAAVLQRAGPFIRG